MINNQKRSENTILVSACMNGDLGIIKYLVEERNLDIHANNEYAFRTAAECGYLDIVKYLVSKGADIHAMDDYAICWAALGGHFETVKYFIEEHGVTHDLVLRMAKWKGHTEIINLLVDT